MLKKFINSPRMSLCNFVRWERPVSRPKCGLDQAASPLDLTTDLAHPMNKIKFPLRNVCVAFALSVPVLAGTTNGYFSHGCGAKAQGAAGVGIALPQDGLAAAPNPAGTAAVG